jgi:hypothetical protein
MPVTFDGSTGIVTAQVSHLCVFALFNEPRAGSAAIQTTLLPLPAAPQLAKAQPPSTAVSIFTGMIGWASGFVAQNMFLVAAVVIAAVAAFLVLRKRREKWD